MTVIAVDWQYRAVDGRRYDILYIGTGELPLSSDHKIEIVCRSEIYAHSNRSQPLKLVFLFLTDDGRVIKAVNKNRSDQIETVIIEDLVVFEDKSPVTKLSLYRRTGNRLAEYLIVVSEKEIRKLPLHRCHLHKDCRSVF